MTLVLKGTSKAAAKASGGDTGKAGAKAAGMAGVIAAGKVGTEAAVETGAGSAGKESAKVAGKVVVEVKFDYQPYLPRFKNNSMTNTNTLTLLYGSSSGLH